eukprot:CAMPEP_0116875324 /NCGR_PEP_ID=MMETSP0463-20121206/7225_1 /TAXON_ID=181622 /ORGANISM="Strombidinopsis sp, Strain SopsisLIS2011" /LENGTH=41 /DNA_ID= /DNA_START= /DNA_END= /DNA_ORIENTATION=
MTDRLSVVVLNARVISYSLLMSKYCGSKINNQMVAEFKVQL